MRVSLGRDVFQEALERLITLYRQGHRLVYSFSSGKDSTVVLELGILAARETGNLPISVVMRDEEILFPGSFEYSERVAARPEVDFHWMYACQPIINVFNRANPYWWVFDPLLEPDQWVRQPPPYAYRIPELHIQGIITDEKFPPPPGGETIGVMGLRVAESITRRLGVASSGGYMKGPNLYGIRYARPIYDWEDADVWRGIKEFGWDYNSAYDTLFRLGMSKHNLRIAPPTLNTIGADSLQVAARAWPKWFDRVCDRLPGVRSVALFGRRACEPTRRLGETWEECFQRTCIEEAPTEWIRERAEVARKVTLERHAMHASTPLPQARPGCPKCGPLQSWQYLVRYMYNGDPFGTKSNILPTPEPDFFRPGSGKWGGSPTF